MVASWYSARSRRRVVHGLLAHLLPLFRAHHFGVGPAGRLRAHGITPFAALGLLLPLLPLGLGERPGQFIG
jgi:hypothetical protein